MHACMYTHFLNLQSGKLVQKMFHKIQELIDDPDVLVCVLIDEVESLTAARKSAMSGSEPSDAIRVVNALLTQLDQIRRYPNVLILTTSNVTGAIDLAFVDRSALTYRVTCNINVVVYILAIIIKLASHTSTVRNQAHSYIQYKPFTKFSCTNKYFMHPIIASYPGPSQLFNVAR